jgi:hypothetical protein
MEIYPLPQYQNNAHSFFIKLFTHPLHDNTSINLKPLFSIINATTTKLMKGRPLSGRCALTSPAQILSGRTGPAVAVTTFRKYFA